MVYVLPEPGTAVSATPRRMVSASTWLTGLAVHHDRCCRLILDNTLDKCAGSSSVHLGIACFLSEYGVEIEIVMVHKPVQCVSL